MTDTPSETASIAACIAWWEMLRQEHQAKGQTIAARKCAEEIGLLRQETSDNAR